MTVENNNTYPAKRTAQHHIKDALYNHLLYRTGIQVDNKSCSLATAISRNTPLDILPAVFLYARQPG